LVEDPQRNTQPFPPSGPRFIDISNCFHLTDEGFTALSSACGRNVVTWKMKSVWDVSATAIHEMVKQAKDLEAVDLSNCRKVNDALLMHVIGNVPLQPPINSQQYAAGRHYPHGRGPPPATPTVNGANTVLGSQKLRSLTLSYCKHVTDRSMAHIGYYARTRLEEVDLTRCTTITDHGFEAWGQHQFHRLAKLCLADCTYLTDNAIVYLTNAAPGLRYLDLVSA
jgi:F-box/leucine-rich repeat protein 7